MTNHEPPDRQVPSKFPAPDPRGRRGRGVERHFAGAEERRSTDRLRVLLSLDDGSTISGMAGRGSRGKLRSPKRARHSEDTARVEIPPGLIESSLADDERPTVTLPAQPSFFPAEDRKGPEKPHEDATVRKRLHIGPDGVPHMLDPDDLDEATHPDVPSKVILVGEMLVAMVGMLREMGDSSRARELRARARRYERVVDGWNAAMPTDAQRDATFDLVAELHGQVMEARGIRRP
jgi:hypothetical protein